MSDVSSDSDVFTDTALKIVDLLKASGKFGTIEILPEFQQDLDDKIKSVASKTTDNVIMVTDLGGENKDQTTNSLRLNHVFSVTLWSQRYIKPGKTTANKLKQSICQVLNNYRPLTPAGNPVHVNERWIVTGCVRVDHPALLVHRIPVQIPVQLPTV